MAVEALRRSIAEHIQGRGVPSHFGLWLNRYNRVLESSSDKGEKWEKTRHDLCEDVPDTVMSLYRLAYKRWMDFLKSDRPWCTSKALTTADRLFIGLGSASVLEFGIDLHHTYGLPYIPGSGIKGVCAAYANKILGEQEEKWKINGAYYRVLFGAPATDTELDTAGVVDFLDAWWVPAKKSPFVAEIINCHHQNYYSSDGEIPPADWDQPIPVKILALAGEFLFAVRGLVGWNDLAMKIIVQALSDWGIGAKTRAGYGLFLKPKDKNRPIATKEGKLEEFKQRIDSNKGTLAGQVNVFLAEIRKETDDGCKTAMAEILKSAFGKDQFKKACKKKKKWALIIRELLNG
jgi:CRISPR-associated protein Cmr6